MPSQIPKTSATRRRGNRTVGARTLQAVPGLKVPALPDWREWNEPTREWWFNLWTSPMAPEYDESDLDELVLLAALYHRFWAEPNEKTASEIRLQRQCFGKTPMDRRRLQWETARAAEAEAEAAKRKAKARPAATTRKDPRKLLA